MKKLISLAVAALFVSGLAASAFAIHAEIPAETTAVIAKGETQVTIGGNLRARYEFHENADANDDTPDHFTRWDQRVRLNVTAQASENTTGYMSVETKYSWGTDGSAAAGFNKGNSRRGRMEILEGHITHNFGPVSVKVGHMPLALGNKLFLDHTDNGDDAVIIYADPADEIHLAGLFIKLEEGNDVTVLNNDDVDAYVVLGTYNTDAFGAGANITYLNDNSGLLRTNALAHMGVAALPFRELDLWNYGVYGNFKAGPVNVRADVEWQNGAIKDDDPLVPNVEFEGTAVVLGADMELGRARVGIEIGRGSGAETGNSMEEFITSLSNRIQYYSFVYDTRTPGASGGTGGGIQNTTYVKGTVGVSFSDALSGKAAVMWLKATEDIAINCTLPIPGCEPTDELGWEVDASVTYDLARNLKYWIEAGYLVTGDAYNSNVGLTLVESDDAYAVRHGLELSF